MAVYLSLVFLALALMTLVWGNYSDRRRRAIHFGVGVTFVALAGIVMIVSAIGSLWFYPFELKHYAAFLDSNASSSATRSDTSQGFVVTLAAIAWLTRSVR